MERTLEVEYLIGWADLNCAGNRPRAERRGIAADEGHHLNSLFTANNAARQSPLSSSGWLLISNRRMVSGLIYILYLNIFKCASCERD